ncbi:UrvD/REP family ATP-dependent DNA helicase [Luteimicrobium subarcticum]|uniref:DNA 3'-5' helicase n=1 Tax=Luteimicrobium subarcticum TaxID=620910 RepID=A0A2M8WUY8_9MICO|nr:UrvD/REP family ATP-dependent DNA helicase [Luteimicrobium subarcticum]PJI94751.1 superfamily I DNA/RNA helicase [Luteimicrobium subarcticum]
MTPAVRLLAPVAHAARDLVLDPSQADVVDAAARLSPGAALLVTGAPGTGRTTVAVEVAADALVRGVAPHRVLLLSATRRGAATVRDVLTARAGRTLSAPLVRTVASVAFAVLAARADALDEPAPMLVSGPEQDLLLAELLAGHVAGEGAPLDLPEGLPPEVLGLRGFRQELRDLLMRAAEHDLGPARLAALGAAKDRPEWVLAAQLYDEYQAVTALGAGTPDRGARFDPAVVVAEAAETLRAWDDELPGTPRPRWDLVVVDDYQEATAATATLLGVLRDDGARLVLLGDPDVAVQGFRGADPSLVGRASAPLSAEPGALGAETLVLGTVHRGGPALRDVVRRVTSAVPTLGAAAHRRAAVASSSGDDPAGDDPAADDPAADDPARGPSADSSGAESVEVATFVSGADEVAYVARALREEHLLRGTSWDRMAVVARAGGQLAALRRGLLAASVPVALLGSDVPLRDEPAVRPLLAAVGLALTGDAAPDTPDELGVDAVEDRPEDAAGDADSAADERALVVAELFTSPVGGLDVVGLRRLRRALRAEERAGGGGRASDALLVEVALDPARTATLPPTVRAQAAAVARVVAAARTALHAPGADPQTVLWAAWAASGLAARWQRTALEGGAAGARADRDLDAVLALFRAAETFVDRLPQASVASFLEHLASQDLPADTLAAQGSGAGSVSALTPAGAAGGEWDVVVVTGVQDGVWPDLRLRDSLLGSQALVEVLARRDVSGSPDGAQARRAVLADELRAFAVAVSRARRRLLVTAVDDPDERPSVFCDLVVPPPPVPDGDGADPAPARVPVRPGAPLDLRGLVATARRRAVADPDSPEGAAAVRLVADLAREGVRGAGPQDWYGASDVSSQAPLVEGDERVRVSPSKVETVRACALRWALESVGGTAPDATHQTLGTLVHAIAEALPSGRHHELADELRRRFPELGLRPGWPTTQTRRRADEMVRRLAEYVAGREVLAVETSFEVEVGERAVLRGTVDRVEAGPRPGTVEVVDLKTGASAPPQKDMPEHPQLGAYQVAVDLGALDGAAGVPDGAVSSAARLVYVGGATKGAAERTQAGLDEDGRAEWVAVVDEVARTMSGSAFEARENKLCRTCASVRSCPVQPEGRQVVA